MNKQFRRALFISIFILMAVLPGLAACQAAATATQTGEVARPSNPGTPGPAVSLSGDITRGAGIFQANCVRCHGAEGKGGVVNTGSTDGTVPPLNPIDDTMVSIDYKTFAENIDLFVEHGSTPEGEKPAVTMPAWGDEQKLKPQEIADVIAYLIHLNAK
jgi:mono/diheme cytochrome c family protein